MVDLPELGHNIGDDLEASVSAANVHWKELDIASEVRILRNDLLDLGQSSSLVHVQEGDPGSVTDKPVDDGAANPSPAPRHYGDLPSEPPPGVRSVQWGLGRQLQAGWHVVAQHRRSQQCLRVFELQTKLVSSSGQTTDRELVGVQQNKQRWLVDWRTTLSDHFSLRQRQALTTQTHNWTRPLKCGCENECDGCQSAISSAGSQWLTPPDSLYRHVPPGDGWTRTVTSHSARDCTGLQGVWGGAAWTTW